MGITPQQFEVGLADLRVRLGEQGRLVREMAERAFEALYARDANLGAEIQRLDDQVDDNDLAIERSAVGMFTAACAQSCPIGPAQIRGVLTAVKVNNELERIADAADAIAERVVNLSDRQTPFPKTTRVMTNSVIGIIRDAVDAFTGLDPLRAKIVLASEDAVLSFNALILRDAEERVADGRMSVDLAFDLHAIANQSVTMADHCTNIAEQVIYEATGAVVRHREGAWREIPNAPETPAGSE